MINRRKFITGCTTTLSALSLLALGPNTFPKVENTEEQLPSMAERIVAKMDTVVRIHGKEVQCIDVKVLPSRFPSIYECQLHLQLSKTEWNRLSGQRDLQYAFVEVYKDGARQTFYCSGCWCSSREYTVQFHVEKTYIFYI